VPPVEPIASHGLRTIPPRENGGNADIKQITEGSRLLIPVNVEGALYSVGDAHFAQGDCECCGTAIEMGSTCHCAIPDSRRRSEASQHPLAEIRSLGLFLRAGMGRSAQFHRDNGHAGPR
jgi:formamidase